MSIIQPNTSYNIVENTISQNAIQFPDSLDNTVVDRIISIGSNGFTLKRDILTTVKETIISAIDITDVNTGNTITFDDLTYLPTGLGALTVPSNPTTCNFNDAIQVQDYNATLMPPPSHSEAKLGANPLGVYGLQFTSTETIATTISNDNSNDMNITAAGNLTITADDNITLTSNGLGNIILSAPNVDSYTYAMPICFTKQRTDAFSYSLGGQNFDLILQRDFAIPQEFVSISSMPVSFTSTIWKIDFAFNMFQVSPMSDKGMGIYIDFIDAASNVYTPITYNDTTPFSIERKDWGYASGVNTPFIPINWTDTVDLGALYNTGTSNFPLDMRIYFAGDSSVSSSYNMLLTLTRTNLV
jgi:hypothetical protein